MLLARVTLVLALALLAGHPLDTWANPADLDASFGSGGEVTTSFGPGRDTGAAVTIDGSGRVVVAGGTANGSDDDVALARYTTNGVLDVTFGVGGTVTTPIGPDDDYATAVAIDGSGRIVVAGFSVDGSGFEDFAVLRYLDNGTLDPTFGTGGKVTTPIGSFDDIASALAIDSSGRIVLAGRAWTVSNYDFALVRYTTTGALDTTFGSGGKVTTAIGSGFDLALAMTLDGSGRIVAVGYSTAAAAEFAVARYLDNGSLDPSFAGDGTETTPILGDSDTAHGVAIDGAGRIVVAGSSLGACGNGYRFSAARYLNGGGLDPSFGTGGKVVTPVGTQIGGIGLGMRLETGGRIVVAGSAWNGTDEDFAVVRYTPDGTPDASFGSGGTVLTPIGPLNDWGQAVAIDGSGRIVVAGYTTDAADTVADFAVVRYLGGGVSGPVGEDVGAKKIFIKDNPDPTKRQVQVQSLDPSVQVSEADDPSANGASLHVYSATDDFCVPLEPGSNWKNTGTKWKYKNKVTKNAALVGNGRLKVKIKSDVTYTLADNGSQGHVNAQVQFGTGTRYCMRCAGNVKDDGAKFLGKNCSVGACDPEPSPCNPPTTITSTTTCPMTSSTVVVTTTIP